MIEKGDTAQGLIPKFSIKRFGVPNESLPLKISALRFFKLIRQSYSATIKILFFLLSRKYKFLIWPPPFSKFKN